MLWTPERCWEGQDAFVIGGGASLRSFDFSKLTGLNTIGCNDAFRLGEAICKVCLFGDASWWQKNKFELEKFKGQMFHVAPSLARLDLPNITGLNRKQTGIADGANIAWNWSTGGAAVNLAINMGAKRIFLLGIDLGLTGGKSHWHDHRPRPTQDQILQRFLGGFKKLSEGLKLPQYEGIQVIHVSDGPVVMPFFMKMPFGELDTVLAQNKPVEVPA